MILVSSCLVGLKCRYDGGVKHYPHVKAYLKNKTFLAVCPEQMGGLSTPREAAEIISHIPLMIKTKKGTDVTSNFLSGVSEVGKLLKHYQIEHAILKSRSPSCGCNEVYDGTFSKKLVKGEGVLARYLKDQKIHVMNENDLQLLEL